MEDQPIIDFPPDKPAGYIYKDGEDREWMKIKITHGTIGGKWAYWRTDSTKAEKVYANAAFEVVADIIFNSSVFHFAGMLATPYDGATKYGWLLVKGGALL